MEGASPKPRGFLRYARSSPGHPKFIRSVDKALRFRRRPKSHGLKFPFRILLLTVLRFPVGKEQNGALIVLIDNFTTGRKQ